MSSKEGFLYTVFHINICFRAVSAGVSADILRRFCRGCFAREFVSAEVLHRLFRKGIYFCGGSAGVSAERFC